MLPVQAEQINDSPKTNEISIKHTPRNYQAFPGSQYALPTDNLERQRLLLQHQNLKKLFENKTLLAPVSLDGSDKVLDIGTGSGLWILDLAETIAPSVSIVAVDIEPGLFPASPPKNIEFRVESVMNLPSDWSDTFSLVHQRLLMLALQVPQWPKAVQEIYRVLRPEGWVQIAEAAAFYEEARNLYVDCTHGIPKMLEEAGFVDIRSESRAQSMGKWAGEIGVANGANYIGVLRGIKAPVLEAGGFGHVTSEAEYDELLDGLEREWDEIPGTEKQFIIFWARKPSP